MSAGELRHLVDIESPIESVSNNGDYSDNTTWSAVASVWARIIYSKSPEESDERDSTQRRATIKIRYRSDVTNKMRIVYGSDIYDIEDNFDPTGKKQYLMIAVVSPE